MIGLNPFVTCCTSVLHAPEDVAATLRASLDMNHMLYQPALVEIARLQAPACAGCAALASWPPHFSLLFVRDGDVLISIASLSFAALVPLLSCHPVPPPVHR